MTDRNHFDVLDEIVLQQAVVQHSLDRLGQLIATYRDLVPTPGENPRTYRKVGIKSLDAWTSWLRDNGPALRQTIAEAVGNLSTSASPHVRKWQEHMEMWADDQISPDTLLSVQATKRGMGRPPMVYFLWSQRYDVRPLFDVGPEPPGIDPTAGHKEVAPPVHKELTEVQPLTGVIQPPVPLDQVAPEGFTHRAPVDDHDHWDGAESWPQQAFDLADGIGEVRFTPLPTPDKPDDEIQ
jgi:hypothetical protein